MCLIITRVDYYFPTFLLFSISCFYSFSGMNFSALSESPIWLRFSNTTWHWTGYILPFLLFSIRFVIRFSHSLSLSNIMIMTPTKYNDEAYKNMRCSREFSGFLYIHNKIMNFKNSNNNNKSSKRGNNNKIPIWKWIDNLHSKNINH